jgi:hypothetical protein
MLTLMPTPAPMLTPMAMPTPTQIPTLMLMLLMAT